MTIKTAAASPSADTDPASDILALVKAVTVLTGDFVAGGSWAVRFPAPERIKFAIVTKGSCDFFVDGHKRPIHAAVGDILLLVARRGFVMASDAAATPVPITLIVERAAKRGSGQVRVGRGDTFVQTGGHIELDATSGRVLSDMLPPWLHIRAGSLESEPLRWIVDQIARERSAGLPGAAAATAQLAQLMFVHVLRAHLNAAGRLAVGWPRLLRDPRLAAALRVMHTSPAAAWTLSSLAKAAGMSRTTFALRFREAAGVAPLTYLTSWRMQLALRALRDGETIAAVSEDLGYASESAFSHAFKRVTGTSPSTVRSAARRSPG